MTSTYLLIVKIVVNPLLIDELIDNILFER